MRRGIGQIKHERLIIASLRMAGNDLDSFVSKAREHIFELQIRCDASRSPKSALYERPTIGVIGTNRIRRWLNGLIIPDVEIWRYVR